MAALAALAGAAPTALAENSPLVTGHPDLTVAQAISSKQVLACFDQILATPTGFNDSSFFLQGYAESRKTGVPGLTIINETSIGGGMCVVALFGGPGDVRSFSRVVVLANAVNSAVPGGGGAANVQGAVPLLGGVQPNGVGVTLRPQLITATPSGSTAVFDFDQPLSTVAAGAKFGFYTNAGDTAFHAGTVSGFAGASATVTFSPADAALLGPAVRLVVGEGSVTDIYGLSNPIGVVGPPTLRLDLAASTGPTPGSGIRYHFDFNKAITGSEVPCPSKFTLYDAIGVRYTAVGTPTISADFKSVNLSFVADTTGGDVSEITLATVAADALNPCGAAGTAPLNSEGAVGFPGNSAPAGSTSGPDLIAFRIDRGTGATSFVFDAPVSSTAIVPSAFHLVDRGAALTAPPNQGSAGILGLGGTPSGPQISVGPSDTVNVNFAVPTSTLALFPGPPDLTAVRSAIGVTVDEGAVADLTTAVASSLGSLGVTPVATPTGPTRPPAPPVPVVAVTPTTSKPLSTKPVSKSCRRVVTVHLRSLISRNVRSATATVNGKKVKVSKGLTVTVSFANYAGSKAVVLRVRGKLANGRSQSKSRFFKNKC